MTTQQQQGDTGMNTQRAIEPQQVFIDLALAVANALECPECPRDLADALLETLTPLEDLLSESVTAYQTCAATLRGLAAMAESGHIETRPEPKAFAAASPDAKQVAYTH
jgi:hypothetical protein